MYSLLRIVKPMGAELHVRWGVADNCPAHYLDMFEPIEGVVFNDPGTKRCAFVDSRNYLGPWLDSPTARGDMYEGLRPRPEILKKIETLPLDDFIAFHVRRSDYRGGTAAISNDELLERAEEACRGYRGVFLATCDAQTQQLFEYLRTPVRHYGEIDADPAASGPQRHTSMERAVLDFYTCVNAASFVGTYGSSYSDLISDLRREPRRTFETEAEYNDWK